MITEHLRRPGAADGHGTKLNEVGLTETCSHSSHPAQIEGLNAGGSDRTVAEKNDPQAWVVR